MNKADIWDCNIFNINGFLNANVHLYENAETWQKMMIERRSQSNTDIFLHVCIYLPLKYFKLYFNKTFICYEFWCKIAYCDIEKFKWIWKSHRPLKKYKNNTWGGFSNEHKFNMLTAACNAGNIPVAKFINETSKKPLLYTHKGITVGSPIILDKLVTLFDWNIDEIAKSIINNTQSIRFFIKKYKFSKYNMKHFVNIATECCDWDLVKQLVDQLLSKNITF
jgi:hypothetical protein